MLIISIYSVGRDKEEGDIQVKKFAMLAGLGAMAFLPNDEVAAESQMKLEVDARYHSGATNEDGGTTEIVSYNKHNDSYYVVNGMSKEVQAISMESSLAQKPFLTINVESFLQDALPNFAYGGLTSVAVHPKMNLVAFAIQAAHYNTDGIVVLMSGDGKLLKTYTAGKQPDNLTFTPDGTKLLVANEGEPREGYDLGAVDPEASVTLIDLSKGYETASVQSLTFEQFDTAQARAQLVEDHVLLKKATKPSVDLEPEYIGVAADSRYAYVALQENNAVATIDLQAREITSVKGLGFKDHAVAGNEIDFRKDGKIAIQAENYKGIYMPDGIAVYSVGDKNYIVTANEGDAREWGTHLNELEVEVDGNEMLFYDTSDYDGFEEGAQYIFGGRSFSIFDAATMNRVFDSGADFEKITAQHHPNHFNSNNTNTKLDNRSGKKGPEPEDVKIGEIDGKTHAFIGLERVGGIVMYDITNPAQSTFVDYLNTRDFSGEMKGDVSPEGLAFVAGEVPKLLIGHEVSGTVLTVKVTKGEKLPFRDIDGHWAQAAIADVYKKGYMKGYTTAQFGPNEQMTRAQVAVTLQRMVGDKAATYRVISDVPKHAHYADAVQWAVSANVLHVNAAQQVLPGQAITRADYALALYSALKQQGHLFGKTNDVAFTDLDYISTKQVEAITVLAGAKIMNGTDPAHFNPTATLTRAQVAATLAKVAQ